MGKSYCCTNERKVLKERIVQRKDENIVIILITSVFLNFYSMRVFIQECSLSKDKNVKNSYTYGRTRIRTSKT